MNIDEIRKRHEENRWKDCCQSSLKKAVDKIDKCCDFLHFKRRGFHCYECNTRWKEDDDAEEGELLYKSDNPPTWKMIGKLIEYIDEMEEKISKFVPFKEEEYE